MAAANVACQNCGFKNNAVGSARCASCGAKLEALGKLQRTREEELERRYQQEGVNVQWLGIALIVGGVATLSVSQ